MSGRENIRFDGRLYLVTNTKVLPPGQTLEQTVDQAIEGGVTVVQMREELASRADQLVLARRLAAIIDGRALLIINNFVDVAIDSGADGVHLGQSDMPVSQARRLMGPEAIIGFTVSTPQEAQQAFDNENITYFGAVVGKSLTTKPNAPHMTTQELADVSEKSPRPVLAIGGITAANAAEIMATGIDGIAVVSAICAAVDPKRAATELRTIVEKFKPDNQF